MRPFSDSDLKKIKDKLNLSFDLTPFTALYCLEKNGHSQNTREGDVPDEKQSILQKRNKLNQRISRPTVSIDGKVLSDEEIVSILSNVETYNDEKLRECVISPVARSRYSETSYDWFSALCGNSYVLRLKLTFQMMLFRCFCELYDMKDTLENRDIIASQFAKSRAPDYFNSRLMQSLPEVISYREKYCRTNCEDCLVNYGCHLPYEQVSNLLELDDSIKAK